MNLIMIGLPISLSVAGDQAGAVVAINALLSLVIFVPVTVALLDPSKPEQRDDSSSLGSHIASSLGNPLVVGTLIGLVLMLGNMADPKAIGPAMAVALLTTLYGAFIANIIFAPMVLKLEGYTAYEVVYREMVVEGLRNIARGESPRNIQDIMLSSLPPKLQAKLAEA